MKNGFIDKINISPEKTISAQYILSLVPDILKRKHWAEYAYNNNYFPITISPYGEIIDSYGKIIDFNGNVLEEDDDTKKNEELIVSHPYMASNYIFPKDKLLMIILNLVDEFEKDSNFFPFDENQRKSFLMILFGYINLDGYYKDNRFFNCELRMNNYAITRNTINIKEKFKNFFKITDFTVSIFKTDKEEFYLRFIPMVRNEVIKKLGKDIDELKLKDFDFMDKEELETMVREVYNECRDKCYNEVFEERNDS